MPEMPEVETMVQRLQNWRGWRITDVKIDARMSAKAAKKFLPGDEYNSVIGQAVVDVYRRGKFIIFMTSSGAILAHNAMSGYWDMLEDPWTFDYVEGDRTSKDTDVRVMFKLECFGEQKTLRLVAQYANACNLFGRAGEETLTHKLDVLKRHCDAVGRPYEEIEKTVLDTVDVSNGGMTPRQVVEKCRRLAQLGFQHIIFNMRGGPEIEQIEILGREVIPEVEN